MENRNFYSDTFFNTCKILLNISLGAGLKSIIGTKHWMVELNIWLNIWPDAKKFPRNQVAISYSITKILKFLLKFLLPLYKNVYFLTPRLNILILCRRYLRLKMFSVFTFLDYRVLHFSRNCGDMSIMSSTSFYCFVSQFC